MDTGCVELLLRNGRKISIDCTGVEDALDVTMAPVSYTHLLLSSLFTGMPPIFPTAPAMMLELCAYGLLTGLFYRRVKWNIYFSLISAMLAGRIVSGIANAAFMGIAGKAYGFSAFLTASFVTAVPGIIIQLVAVPLIVICLEKARLMESPKQNAYRVA